MTTLSPVSKWHVEIRTLFADFASKLAVDETLIPVPAISTDDPAISAALVSFTDTTVRLQVAGGVPGETYRVIVAAPTSQANRLVLEVPVEVLQEHP